MMLPDFMTADEVLEWAAKLIEEPDFTDRQPAASKRKRDRQDAELWERAAAVTRKRCAEHIRAFKSRPELSPKEWLKHFAEMPEQQHAMYLREAWPLTFKGWLDIDCRLKCNSNCVPPEAEYRITLTDKGRAILQAEAA